ncbi:MAG TPA: hypothetical protein VJ323_05160, partial [Bryobacteraceae bacterium]|nr:hypothetical protein [Bryobacteraceae bacterium]
NRMCGSVGCGSVGGGFFKRNSSTRVATPRVSRPAPRTVQPTLDRDAARPKPAFGHYSGRRR